MVLVGGAAAAIWATPPDPRNVLGHEEWFVPDADEGEVRRRDGVLGGDGRRGRTFTAVPAGHGNGAGLPVVVVLHGASATVDEFGEFGFPQFVTAAVEAGAPPFVLVGPEDGPSGWVADGDVDPPAFLRDELPALLAQRGYDAGTARGVGLVARRVRRAAAGPRHARLRAGLGAVQPGRHRGRPRAGGPVRAGRRTGRVWCGTDDAFYPAVRAVADRLPQPPDPAVYEDGGTRGSSGTTTRWRPSPGSRRARSG